MMLTRTRARMALTLAGVLLACGASSASASPVTVNLRIEGSSSTLYEGPITTDARTITGPDNQMPPVTGPHPCDFKDNGGNGGFGPSLGTPTTAVYDAAQTLGIPFAAEWFGGGTNDFFVTQIGSDVNQNSGSFASWGFALNYTTSSVGGCQTGLSAGSDVLWAYDFFNKSHLLKLTGPTAADVGQPITVNVVDGQSGQTLSGASVGAATTDASGNAQVTFSQTGVQSLKATRSDSVRSNRLDVCVHNGNDGTCGTTAPQGSGGSTPAPTSTTSTTPIITPSPAITTPVAPQGEVKSIRNGTHFAHGHGPRILRGAVVVGSGGLKQVRLRVERTFKGRCQALSPRSERFVAITCGAQHAPWISAGDAADFSYLLPFALPRGRYVLDVQAVDQAGRGERFLVPGRNRVVFSVG
jgi:hypothetical protein